MRLNAFLARAGVSSRRGADKLIIAGRVTVNGKAAQLNDQISAADIVKVDGQKVRGQSLRYILYYKPARTVTTLNDPEGRPTILDDVKIPERIVPVGRLDFDTTGALLLTNDGELAHQLMHPKFEIDKVYEAAVEGQITPEKLSKLSKGLELSDGRTAPAKVRQLAGDMVELIIHEGRNHQVKRMLEAVDLPVKRLHRSQYGPFRLDGLRPGQWRDLEQKQIDKLKN